MTSEVKHTLSFLPNRKPYLLDICTKFRRVVRMDTQKILVFGGTGPTGICLLRELLHRQHPTIAYARNPSKIPQDLALNPLLEVHPSILTRPRLVHTYPQRLTSSPDYQGRNNRCGNIVDCRL